MKRFLAIIIALCVFPVSSACAYTSAMILLGDYYLSQSRFLELGLSDER